MTTLPPALSTAAITPIDADLQRQRARKIQIEPALAEERGAHDDFDRSGLAERSGPSEAPDAAPHAAGEPAADLPDEGVVRTRLEGAVEIDELHARVLRESRHPRKHIVARHGEPLALDELNDLAALEIDRWDEHAESLAE